MGVGREASSVVEKLRNRGHGMPCPYSRIRSSSEFGRSTLRPYITDAGRIAEADSFTNHDSRITLLLFRFSF